MTLPVTFLKINSPDLARSRRPSSPPPSGGSSSRSPVRTTSWPRRRRPGHRHSALLRRATVRRGRCPSSGSPPCRRRSPGCASTGGTVVVEPFVMAGVGRACSRRSAGVLLGLPNTTRTPPGGVKTRRRYVDESTPPLRSGDPREHGVGGRSVAGRRPCHEQELHRPAVHGGRGRHVESHSGADRARPGGRVGAVDDGRGDFGRPRGSCVVPDSERPGRAPATGRRR